MNNSDEEKVNKLIHSIGLKYNLRDSEVREIIESQFRFAYEKIKELDFKDKSDEDIKLMKTNFYFKYIGKLYVVPHIVEYLITKVETEWKKE